MKRITAMILCLALLCAAAITAGAAGSAHMGLSASSGTVHRGDTFTLTVSLSNDQPVSNGGIQLSYDSSVFELVSGQCAVSGAILSEVSAAKNGGVFMMQTDTVVSGTIFTIQMRVKADAAFGTYSISGTPSLAPISCGISGTAVTVACRHNYQNCTKVNDSDHKSTCKICGDEKTEAHTWNAGTVTKAPTCKDTGSKAYTCSVCGAEKAEVLPVTDSHSFGSWNKVNDSSHSGTCSVCGKTETRNHSWNTGRVTKAATCKDTGSRVRTCIDCSATKTETISKTGHSYGQWSVIDDSSHTHSCTVCGKEESGAHSYDGDLEHDAQAHFQSCDQCGNMKDPQPHVPGPEATETTDQLCTVCGRVLRSMANHTHVFAEDWTGDTTGHWHACNECTEQDSFSAHDYDSSCDTACSICGMERTVPHDPSERFDSDETGHWYICLSCGEKVDFETHTPGAAATVTSAQLCTVCGFEIAPVLPHDHYDGTTHLHQCACGEVYEADAKSCEICKEENRSFPWWIICILEALLFGGAAAYYFLWYKKPPKTEDYLP